MNGMEEFRVKKPVECIGKPHVYVLILIISFFSRKNFFNCLGADSDVSRNQNIDQQNYPENVFLSDLQA